MRILVTGGAGFIGSAVVRRIIDATSHEALVYDKLTYAGNLASLASVAGSPRYRFERGDICDARRVQAVLASFRPHWVMNLAAESHVDRSIDSPAAFIHTNVLGTGVMLSAFRTRGNRDPVRRGSDARDRSRRRGCGGRRRGPVSFRRSLRSLGFLSPQKGKETQFPFRLRRLQS